MPNSIIMTNLLKNYHHGILAFTFQLYLYFSIAWGKKIGFYDFVISDGLAKSILGWLSKKFDIQGAVVSRKRRRT